MLKILGKFPDSFLTLAKSSTKAATEKLISYLSSVISSRLQSRDSEKLAGPFI